MGTADTAKIVNLRRVLAERFPGAVAGKRAGGVVATGLGCLDGPFGGGLPLGEVVEVVAGGRSSGAGLLLVALLRRALADHPCVALVDGRDSFDPADLPPKLLRRLLWVRCQAVRDALRPVDALLRDGNVPLVVLDLRGNPPAELGSIPQHAWFRFLRVAEQAGTVLLALVPRPMACGARWRLRLDSRFDLGALERGQVEMLRSLRMEIVRARGPGMAAAVG
ncbi:MAG TPA: hypothetical protein PLU30_06600 [Verrucomicrobiae bacterium]|nr:hypothetical protein [Verrucomicrobiae bacterium]